MESNGQNGLQKYEATTDSAWTPQRVDLVKRQVCPKGISDDEFAVFIAQCQRTGLDPLIREAFCTPRKENIGTRDNPKWITKHVFVPGHDGMLARADRFPDFRGVRGAAVYRKDTLTIDEAEGIVRHTWSPIGDRGELVGAWAMALRDGRKYPVEWVLLSEYRDERNPQWRERPQTMIVKCARVAALRRAYPNSFGSIYIKEEMPDDTYRAAPLATKEAPPIEDATLLAADATPAPAPEDALVAELVAAVHDAQSLRDLRATGARIAASKLGSRTVLRDAYSVRQRDLHQMRK